MSTDLVPQVLIKRGPAERPIVIPVDADGADGDPNNTPRCPVAARRCLTITQLLRAIVAAGARCCECTRAHGHTSTRLLTHTLYIYLQLLND